MTRESTDVDTAEQVIDSFRILAADKVRVLFFYIIDECFISDVSVHINKKNFNFSFYSHTY